MIFFVNLHSYFIGYSFISTYILIKLIYKVETFNGSFSTAIAIRQALYQYIKENIHNINVTKFSCSNGNDHTFDTYFIINSGLEDEFRYIRMFI